MLSFFAPPHKFSHYCIVCVIVCVSHTHSVYLNLWSKIWSKDTSEIVNLVRGNRQKYYVYLQKHGCEPLPAAPYFGQAGCWCFQFHFGWSEVQTVLASLHQVHERHETLPSFHLHFTPSTHQHRWTCCLADLAKIISTVIKNVYQICTRC